MSQLLLDDSPYLTSIKYRYNLRLRAYRAFVKMAFRHSTNHFYTENPFISERLKRLYPRASVNTVTNYYNQVFDQKDRWLIFPLPTFDGITLLSVVTPYPHKNVTIAAEIARYLRKNYPKFKFRFVFSFDKDEFHASINGVEENFLFIGKVDVSECPSLYMQSDIVFVSSLLECFTAAYPEAMRMEKPIVTTDLEFAHGLCGYAACYYSATDSVAAAEAIYKVATDKEYNRQLVENGKMQLKTFDNYEQRAEKIIKILERM